MITNESVEQEGAKANAPASQESLNSEMVNLGAVRYRNRVADACEKGEASATQAGMQILRSAIPATAEALEVWCRDVAKAPAHRSHTSVALLRMVKPRVAAALICRVVLDAVAMSGSNGAIQNTNGVCLRIAKAIENEARFSRLKKDQPFFWRVSIRKQKNASFAKLQKTFKKVATESQADTWVAWTTTELAHVGFAALDLFRTATGLVEYVEVPTGGARSNRTVSKVVATEETWKWLSDFNQNHESMQPMFMPMVTPPADWVAGQAFGGGYGPVHDGLNLPMVKTANKRYLALLEQTEMPDVLLALNQMQSTPWKVNRQVLEVMRALAAHSRDLPEEVMPQLDDSELPERPEDMDTNEEARKTWKRAAALVYGANEKLRSKRVQTIKLLWLAEKFKDAPAIYFPYQMDFRGRTYAVPYFLQPQGQDSARGLLSFATGKPIETQLAREWLAVFGANLFGVDKTWTFAQRVTWTSTQTQFVTEVAADPLTNRGWMDAEKPWQFLAWCFEYAAFLKAGMGFVSTIPIAMDASNNGLQILSLMMKDEVGGKFTNCLPSPTPQDIYREVADRVIATLKTDESELGRIWKTLEIDRKTCKRPVMVLPYGGTLYSCRQYVEEWLLGQMKKGKIVVPEWPVNRLHKPSHYLATIIWSAINGTVGSAQQAMGYLQEMADCLTEEGLPVRWTAPTGFPVLQQYFSTTSNTVKTTLGGNVKYIRFADATRNLDKARQRNGIAPNFVHSLDAAALHRSVASASKSGVSHFAMIHDSYGTLAADVEQLSIILRLEYSKIFKADVLGMFHEEQVKAVESVETAVTLPRVPEKGLMDAGQVNESAYFFL